jgi:energy-coupling factor transport system ATP-binding protein
VSALSGGEKQRVAIAAVLAAQPHTLVLDEPTSQLDPHGAEEVLTALQKLNADLGLTIILCEHRLERVVQYADRILFFPGGPGAAPKIGPTREMLGKIGLVPPLQGLGRALGWEPLPLTIKEGRAFIGKGQATGNRQQTAPAPVSAQVPILNPQFAISITGVTVRYGEHEALYRLSLDARPGELLALMGRNGSGKSTLLKALVGLTRPSEGRISIGGRDIIRTPTEELARTVGYVPQDPRSILYHDTLREELEFTLRAREQGTGNRAQVAEDKIRKTLASLGIAHLAEAYPRALSGGEAQRAALAAILVGDPAVLLLDEPTRGLDYAAKADLAEQLRAICSAGRTVIMATHDVELAASCADRVALLGDGELVVEGPAAEVLGDSLFFSSQIAKLFPGSGWLTLADALGGLGL